MNNAVAQGEDLVAGLGEAGVGGSEGQIAALVATVAADQQKALGEMLAGVADKMDPSQVTAAVQELSGTLEVIEGAAVLAVVAGGFQVSSSES